MPINYRYYSRSKKNIETLNKVKNIFSRALPKIETPLYHLKSNEVLKVVEQDLTGIGFDVEKPGKKVILKAPINLQNTKFKEFHADAYSKYEDCLIEVEAGRAVENNQFLKDLFEACVIDDVKYLCIAVPNQYKFKSKGKNMCKNVFDIVCEFIDVFYTCEKNGRLNIPLNGILIIGY